jgi:hypothetical protein
MLIQFFSEKCRRFYAPACGKSQFPAIFLDLIFARQMRRLSGLKKIRRGFLAAMPSLP